MDLSTKAHAWRVVALYRFFPVADPQALRDRLLLLCRDTGIRGTLIVAPEGLNGTLAGTSMAIDALITELNRLEGFEGAEVKFSSAAEMPFRRLKIRVKREIVTMGVDDIDAAADRGAYVEPADWNALIADPGTIVIDTRNLYETAIGTFKDAIDPETSSFREFPDWVERNHNRLKNRRIAMFCTGGIRCEKATAYVKSLGFSDVFHLRGGILKYLETVPEDESLWRGECFVFDERVSVAHGLVEGEAALCRACRHPLTAAELASPDYVEGVSCPHCHSTRSEADRRRYAERQRQVERALERGEPMPIGLTQPRSRRT